MTDGKTTVGSTTSPRGKYSKARAMREALSLENKRLGKFMATVRKATGMSQRRLSKHLGVAHSWVGKNEAAQRGVSVEDFIKWAHGVNQSASELLGRFLAEEPDPPSREGVTPGSDAHGSC